MNGTGRKPLIGLSLYRSTLGRSILAASLMVASGGASAGTDFGTHEDVLEAVERVRALIDESGADYAAVRLRDASTELGGSPMGIALSRIEDGQMFVVAHNKHPEIDNLDFSDVEDLRGNRMMDDFIETSNAGGDYVLNYWPHYVEEYEYEYHCFNAWAIEGSYIINVCR